MKKFAYLLLSLIMLASCKKEAPKDYITLTGTIKNKKDSVLLVNSRMSTIKKIKVNDDGTFKDTLKANEDYYLLTNGPTRTVVKLKNGYDLDINFDADNDVETVKFTGEGATTNNYIADKIRLQKEYKLDNPSSYFELDKPEFDAKVAEIKQKMETLLADNTKDLDSAFNASEINMNSSFLNFMNSSYERLHPIAKGQPSPQFNFPDIHGKMVSLESLKGKYVYIDAWATWCNPCLKEIPSLKELEKEYHDKNIAFVSLSLDKKEDKDKWKKMVAEKDLQGIQLFEDMEGQSNFVQMYNISNIPRFILIAPDGTIVSNRAPRPSDPELKTLFSDLNI